MSITSHLPKQHKRPSHRFLAILSTLLFLTSKIALAQGVGINTLTPDPSAALDIVSSDKGLLIPRVSLQSVSDNATVPNPATALLVYNTNAGLGKTGFYYNAGTAASPAWSIVGGGVANLALPFSQVVTHNGPLFLINNNDGNSSSIAISGIAVNAIAMRGATVNGTGVVGNTSSSGRGVLAAAANTNGTALEVSGPIKIHGPGQSPGAGKVLTSDANGNATWDNVLGNVAFRASGIPENGSEKIAPGSVSKVAFAIQDYDLGSNYNDVQGSPHSTFIAPLNGIYHFDLTLLWNISSYHEYGTRTRFIRTRGGLKVPVSSILFQSGKDGTISSSIDLQLLQGDMIHIEGEYFGDDEISIGTNSDDSHFSGRLIMKQ
ncbi:hypothetical protein [Dyadobacter chenhuakuii]|uniref:C1q domain-containing protein n=1 Tax=Dyadobacter chenhuakuii TaxID=2909339 RepID=A0ABY4XJ62_9BACT|nr:hypothetical protein [Dyadobacter chenhuakuii]MCF2496415.1 hypothetical protein [Dyadobacter chenhuakuii]USJ30472.1 hypothetical protein NFI80_21755 [Dyadobacter chenhuakuii]